MNFFYTFFQILETKKEQCLRSCSTIIFFSPQFFINRDIFVFRSISPEKAACSIDEAFLKEVIDAIIQDPQIGNEK